MTKRPYFSFALALSLHASRQITYIVTADVEVKSLIIDSRPRGDAEFSDGAATVTIGSICRSCSSVELSGQQACNIRVAQLHVKAAARVRLKSGRGKAHVCRWHRHDAVRKDVATMFTRIIAVAASSNLPDAQYVAVHAMYRQVCKHAGCQN